MAKPIKTPLPELRGVWEMGIRLNRPPGSNLLAPLSPWEKTLVDNALTNAIAAEERSFFGSSGRGKGAIRKAVDKLLAKNPKMKNAEIWRSLETKPPKGFSFYESPRLGRYIEGPSAGEGLEYRRFQNLCSEARKQLKDK